MWEFGVGVNCIGNKPASDVRAHGSLSRPPLDRDFRGAPVCSLLDRKLTALRVKGDRSGSVTSSYMVLPTSFYFLN